MYHLLHDDIVGGDVLRQRQSNNTQSLSWLINPMLIPIQLVSILEVSNRLNLDNPTFVLD